MARAAQPTTANATAPPTRTADGASEAGWGITPVWNPMIILAFFYAVLFLIFASVVGFIFVRRRRRALALARAEEEAAAAASAASPTATTSASQDPEKGQTQASVSGESDGDGDGDASADKTMAIAQAGAGGCGGSPASDGKRYYTADADAPSEGEDWTPPLPRSTRFSSRTSTRTSLAYQCNVSDISVAQREASQVLVWLPSFQSNAARSSGAGSGVGATRVREGEQGSEGGSGEQEQEKGIGEQKREQEREEQEQEQEHEREQAPAKEDSETGYGVAQ